MSCLGATTGWGRGEAGAGAFSLAPALSEEGREVGGGAGPTGGAGAWPGAEAHALLPLTPPSLSVPLPLPVPAAVQAAAHAAAQGERGPDAAQLPLLPGAALPLPVLGLRAARRPAAARCAPRHPGPCQPGRRAAARPPALLVLPHLPRGLPPLPAPELPAALSLSDPGLRGGQGTLPTRPQVPPLSPRGQGCGAAGWGLGARGLLP